MRLPLLATAALLIALPAAAQERYTALGTKPFWSLVIEGKTMRFEGPARQPVTVAKPKVIHGFAGEIYQTRRINVNIVHKPCRDALSERTFADSVTVRVDDRRYQGCGGAVIEQRPLDLRGEWQISLIDGRPAAARATIRFEGDRVSGTTGCNRFSGSYRFERGRLVLGPLAMTRMACPGPRMEQEQRLTRLFALPLNQVPGDHGRVVLESGEASVSLDPVGRR
jgi:heat shock protein HslJ